MTEGPRIFWVQWIHCQLDNYAAVEDVVQHCPEASLIDLWPGFPVTQFSTADSGGHTAAIEFVEAKPVVSRAERMPQPILPNVPLAMNRLTHLIGAVWLTVFATAPGLRAGEIHDAAVAGDLAKVRTLLAADSTLLESRDDDGNTPLHRACLAKQTAVASLLLDQSANVNAPGQFEFTPLIWASDVLGQDLALLQRLLDKGADIRAQGYDGTTALHRAAFRGGPDTAKFLLEHGAAVNVQAYNGVTPLHRAAQSGDVPVARLLLQHGADVNAYDHYTGPVGPADISGTVLQVAFDCAPKEEMAQLLVERGAKLDRRDSAGNTILHLAALKGYADLTRLLVKHGVEVDAVNTANRTALYYAAKHGYRATADALIAAGAKQSAIVEANFGKAPQLTAPLKEGEAYLWYSSWLGFVVKTKGHLILFNPSGIEESLEAGLANGRLNPSELAGLKITVLSTLSERFQDGPDAFALAKRIPGINLVFAVKPTVGSAAATELPPYRLAAPNESFSVGGIQVHTIPALGGGMGYLVEADGVKVFHAGLHVSDNDPANVAAYRKEIDFLKPFGPIDIAILSAYGHNNRVGTAYEPYLYLIDQLAPKGVYLLAANNPEQYPKCAEVLRARNIPVTYPEGGTAMGERFHFVREEASAIPQIGADRDQPNASRLRPSYLNERARFQTRLARRSPTRGAQNPQTSPVGIETITYTSGDLNLRAWLTDHLSVWAQALPDVFAFFAACAADSDARTATAPRAALSACDYLGETPPGDDTVRSTAYFDNLLIAPVGGVQSSPSPSAVTPTPLY